MIYSGQISMLSVPTAYDPQWTELSRVLSDQVPELAGVGAMQIAQQALGLTPQQAAALVVKGGVAGFGAGVGYGWAPTQLLIQAQKQAEEIAIAKATAQSAKSGSYAGRIPIPGSVITAKALLAGDANRSSLLIQNNEASGGATLYVSIDGPVGSVSPAFVLNLVPQQGLFQDQNVWTNPIYVAWSTAPAAGGVLFFGTAVSQAAVPTPKTPLIGMA
jgi:hypothetical protein